MHAWTAVTMVHFGINFLHLRHDPCVLHLAPASTVLHQLGPPALPKTLGVVATRRYRQPYTHVLHRMCAVLRHYESVLGYGGCEKIAMAFFKISHSCCRIAFYCCSRPRPGNASPPSRFAARAQCFSKPWLIPSLGSNSAIVFPLVCASSTTDFLNSQSYFCRPCIPFPLQAV